MPWSLHYFQGLSGRTSYRKISRNLEAARFGLRLFQSLWQLTDTSTFIFYCFYHFFYHVSVSLFARKISLSKCNITGVHKPTQVSCSLCSYFCLIFTPGNPFAYPGINITRPFCYSRGKCPFWLISSIFLYWRTFPVGSRHISVRFYVC